MKRRKRHSPEPIVRKLRDANARLEHEGSGHCAMRKSNGDSMSRWRHVTASCGGLRNRSATAFLPIARSGCGRC